MEVLQNADDNEYTKSVAPTLYISVFPQFVKIECNETGFTKDTFRLSAGPGEVPKSSVKDILERKESDSRQSLKLLKEHTYALLPFIFS